MIVSGKISSLANNLLEMVVHDLDGAITRERMELESSVEEKRATIEKETQRLERLALLQKQ